jgi:hypothetical protein
MPVKMTHHNTRFLFSQAKHVLALVTTFSKVDDGTKYIHEDDFPLLQFLPSKHDEKVVMPAYTMTATSMSVEPTQTSTRLHHQRHLQCSPSLIGKAHYNLQQGN